jgi:hypothetical protein
LSGRPKRRRQSWNRSQSESFGPIRQVGLAASIGFPLMVVGLFMAAIAYSSGETDLLIIAGALFVAGILIASSGRVT